MANKSEFFTELHRSAKRRQSFYAQKYPDKEQPAYSEFLKNENPTDANIIAYEVSYQLSYESAKSGLKMRKPSTFTIYAIGGMETAESIYEKTKSMVLDLKGSITGDTMGIETQKYFDSNDSYLNIEVNPRGLEKVEKKSFTTEQYSKLLNSDVYVEHLDNEVELTNKKNYTSKMKSDITHFM